MDCTSTLIPYRQIGSFSKIIVDYLDNKSQLLPFFKHAPTLEGIKQSIRSRQAFVTDRALLCEVLEDQYKKANLNPIVQQNIDFLAGENTFTVVTAHQPNIFTGYLYFIYKILHTVKLASFLGNEMPQYKFVPVYYMGSEDADLDELGNIYLNGEKIVWETSQKGAVGRMKNKGLEKIIERLSGELSVLPFGEELIKLLRDCYIDSPDVQTATFKLVNALFGEYGVIVLLPDNARLKKAMTLVFEDDLLHQVPSSIVGKTIDKLAEHYKVQATPRDINLFYLKDDTRARIVNQENDWKVVGTDIQFSQSELLTELNDFPERFSPNVILRGLFQETILPNIAFIGGGGEMAYWLELKDLFSHYQVPFPALILRNSFLFIEKSWKERIDKLDLQVPSIFKDDRLLIEDIVKRDTLNQLDLSVEIDKLQNQYDTIGEVASRLDATLTRHVEALKTRAIEKLLGLEKKMLRAEKRKFEAQQSQIHTIKEKLFPGKGLQERVENFMPYYAKFGKKFISMIYDHSPALGEDFVVLVEEC